MRPPRPPPLKRPSIPPLETGASPPKALAEPTQISSAPDFEEPPPREFHASDEEASEASSGPPPPRGSVSRSGVPPLRLDRAVPKGDSEASRGHTSAEPFDEKTPPDGALPRMDSLTGHAVVGEGFDDDIHTSLDAHVAEGRAQSLSRPPPAPRPKRRPVVEAEPTEEQPKLRLAAPTDDSPVGAPPADDSPLAQIAQLAPAGAAQNVKSARESRFKLRRLPSSDSPFVSRRDAVVLVALFAAGLAVWAMDRARAGRRVIEGPRSLISRRAADPAPVADETVYEEAPAPPPPAADFVPTAPSKSTIAVIPPPEEPAQPDLQALEERERALSEAYAAKMGKTATGDALKPEAVVTGTSRKLIVKSKPSGAEVIVRGEKVGVTPLETEIRGDGPLEVSIQSAGRKPWSAKVPPNSRGQYVIDAQLLAL